MQVGAIADNQTFCGKIKKTKKGNEYETSNDGKLYEPVIGLGLTGISTGIAIKQKDLKKKYIKKVQNLKREFKTDQKIIDSIDNLDKLTQVPKEIKISPNDIKKFKNTVKIRMVKDKTLTVAMIGLFWGVITDALINKRRRKDSDNFSQTGNVEGKTNKGKIICGGIGVFGYGLSVLSKIQKLSSKKIKPIQLATPLLIIVSWLTTGMIYDHNVNKAREKLAQKKVDSNKI